MADILCAAPQQPQTWLFVAIGFVAQLCDGALGMGFGAIGTTALAAAGLPPAVASASINGAKIFTGLASGTAHLLLRNVNGPLLTALAAGGVVGGICGATLLAHVSGRAISVAVSAYLLGLGIFILMRAFGARGDGTGPRSAGGVGLLGGFFEAVAGVWGPLVTSNLIAFGASPRHAIGTGSVAETLVAAMIFGVLVHHLGTARLSVTVLALLAGAMFAAPLAARLTRVAPRRELMIGVGVLVVVLSLVRLGRELG